MLCVVTFSDSHAVDGTSILYLALCILDVQSQSARESLGSDCLPTFLILFLIREYDYSAPKISQRTEGV